MKRIFLVTHGETDWNREGRFQGRRDTPLNDRGRGQARSAAGALLRSSVDRVVSSPLSRAVGTAEATASLLGLGLETHPGLIEIDHGLWEGHTAGEVESLWPGMLTLWHSRPEEVTMPGGENLHEVSRRAWGAFREILAGPGDALALFSHDAVLKVLLCRVFDAPLGSFWRFRLGNGSITLLEETPRGLEVLVLGEACHLGSAWERVVQEGL